MTNKHVLDGGFHVLRLNTMEGKTHTIESKPDSWTLHPDGDDVAVMPMPTIEGKIRWFSIPIEKFIDQDILKDYGIGPGDETFLIGRLVTAAGHQRNTPVVRFGNLSMMADTVEPVTLEGGQKQESFLVECRSLSGFSGSPVFVHTTQTYRNERLPKEFRQNPPPAPQPGVSGVTVTTHTVQGTFGPWLLGIDCAHVPLWKPVFEGKTKTNYRVEANTGIACVIPAWRILDLLNLDELVKARKADDEQISRDKEKAAVFNGGDTKE